MFGNCSWVLKWFVYLFWIFCGILVLICYCRSFDMGLKVKVFLKFDIFKIFERDFDILEFLSCLFCFNNFIILFVLFLL